MRAHSTHGCPMRLGVSGLNGLADHAKSDQLRKHKKGGDLRFFVVLVAKGIVVAFWNWLNDAWEWNGCRVICLGVGVPQVNAEP